MKFFTNIREVPIEQVRPNVWNPNVMSAEARQAMRQLMSDFGFFGAILVRKVQDAEGEWYEIIDGEQRWAELVQAGSPTCPVIEYAADDEAAKVLTIALNNLRGENDIVKMSQLVQSLSSDGKDGLVKYAALKADYLERLSFNWDAFVNCLDVGEEPLSVKDRVRLSFTFDREQAVQVKEAIVNAKVEYSLNTDEEVLLFWATHQVKKVDLADNWTRLEFVLHQEQVPVVEQAIEAVAQILEGENKRGRALELIAADFLAAGGVAQIED